MQTINLKTLASALGLSVSTVSKALQDSHEISPETKQRVWQLARELDYVPNPHASSLRRKRSKIIAVVIPEVADSFFTLAMKGIEVVAQQKGYHTLIYLTYESLTKEQTILHDFQSGRVDGLIISLSGQTTHIDHVTALERKGIPVVLFDRIFEGTTLPLITTNDLESGYLATQHLIRQQCRRIAFLSVSDSLSITRQRQQGYLNALTDSHLPSEPDLMLTLPAHAADQEAIMTQLLTGPKAPDGIVASVEKTAILTYQLCEKLHLSIPEQLKVISFSNLETAPLLNPSLSTITQPAFDMGEAAARTLFGLIERKSLRTMLPLQCIPSVLIPRRSTQLLAG
ncbi:LacI family DNA-binding transcriptional regulator [Arsenicibacter rosenii]|uniref:LacI family transcriptional regulator n=1 Tax=Arsenicibacter rosenii TaxID=1750698 RepID=A0A1S2VM72_9BACT|nr:LacI family DNA-binding transcriptional regulator [Arsenicibacter rosenii]OIN59877.1 LacI family transcriptional regulator [Arsenicibacter rosenii]